MLYSGLSSTSINAYDWRDKVLRVLTAALQAVDPFEAVSTYLDRDGDILSCNGKRYDLESFGDIYVIGAGKAGYPMSRAVVSMLSERLRSGIVIIKEDYQHTAAEQPLPVIEILQAGHPIPDERGVQATRRLSNLLQQTKSDDLVVCLISGGGSALLTDPAQGITLDDLQNLTASLLASGASIDEINTLRKHLDRIKGGNLARQVAPAALLTLILSDVVGNPLDIIASGPTVPDPSTYAQALDVLRRYNLIENSPPTIRAHLQKGVEGLIPETPKPGDPLFDAVQNTIVGSNILAAQAAIRQAEQEGYQSMLLTTYLQGEARQAGRMLAAIARQIDATGQPVSRPACVVAGGETTVTIQGEGLGGRNQELALGAVQEMHGIPNAALITLASDGGDGPTDAAGAVVTGETLNRARDLGLQPADFLARNDAYHFFDPLGDLIKTGPTQTNINDLTFLFMD